MSSSFPQGVSMADALRFHQDLLATARPAGSVEDRLALIEAERDVQELLIAYSVHYEARDLDSLVELFADDAVLRNVVGEHVGRQAIRDNYVFLMDHLGLAMHFITNITVRVDSATAARASSYLHSIAVRRRDGYTYGNGGTYSDRIERRDGVWQIVERLGTAPLGYDLQATPPEYDRFALSREPH
jgi:ketosteroid isomerase-like protein